MCEVLRQLHCRSNLNDSLAVQDFCNKLIIGFRRDFFRQAFFITCGIPSSVGYKSCKDGRFVIQRLLSSVGILFWWLWYNLTLPSSLFGHDLLISIMHLSLCWYWSRKLSFTFNCWFAICSCTLYGSLPRLVTSFCHILISYVPGLIWYAP